MAKQYLDFKITHQQIERLDDFYVVGGSRGYLHAKFCFCDDWSGETITAVFSGGGKNYSQILVNGECEVPWEVLRCPKFYVSCFGGSLITANSVCVKVDMSHCPLDTDPSIAPTPSAYEQIVEAAESAKGFAEDAKYSAGEAVQKAILAELHSENAQEKAEEAANAADKAQSYASNPCIIGENGNWWAWNGADYVDTGKPSQGEKGDNGKDGVNGADGKDGTDGKNGTDGYSPVRGKDYWTPEDIAEIKSYVDDAILGGAW